MRNLPRPTLVCVMLFAAAVGGGCDWVGQPAAVGVSRPSDADLADFDDKLVRANDYLDAGDPVNAESVLGELRPMMATADSFRRQRYKEAEMRLATVKAAPPATAPMSETMTAPRSATRPTDVRPRR